MEMENDKNSSTPLESRRGQARVTAMRFLFEFALNPSDQLEEALENHLQHMKVREGIADYAKQLIRLSIEHHEQVVQIISDHLENWNIERLSAVDRTVLKLGVVELLYIESVPPKVTINEMVELAKIYGSADSPGFVNGVLDAIHLVFKERGLI